MKNKYEVRGDFTVIFMNFKGKVVETIIDNECFEKVNRHLNTWYVDGSSGDNYMYAVSQYRTSEKRHRVSLHRIIMDAPAELFVDHINHNTLDNRKCNLRLATPSENQQNVIVRKDNKSTGHRNITYNKDTNTWIAYLTVNGKRCVVGSFEQLEIAIESTKKARSKLMPFSKDAQDIFVSQDENVLFDPNAPRRTNKSSKIKYIHRSLVNNTWIIKYKRKYYGSYTNLDLAIKALVKVKDGSYVHKKIKPGPKTLE